MLLLPLLSQFVTTNLDMIMFSLPQKVVPFSVLNGKAGILSATLFRLDGNPNIYIYIYAKSILTPKQVVPYLGFLVHSVRQAFVLIEEKKAEVSLPHSTCA